MEILIVLFFVAAIGFQVLNLIDWVLKKFGFFKTTFEKALSHIGYSKKYYYKNGSTDMVFLQKLETELHKMRDNLTSDSRSALYDRILIDLDLNKVCQDIENLRKEIRHNSFESTRERLKNNHNLIV